ASRRESEPKRSPEAAPTDRSSAPTTSPRPAERAISSFQPQSPISICDKPPASAAKADAAASTASRTARALAASTWRITTGCARCSSGTFITAQRRQTGVHDAGRYRDDLASRGGSARRFGGGGDPSQYPDGAESQSRNSGISCGNFPASLQP